MALRVSTARLHGFTAIDALPEGVQAVASVLDLPARLQDLGRRGFWVAAVHPLLLPWGRRRSLLDQMLRLILVRPSPSAVPDSEPPRRCRLLVEECPLPGAELTTEGFKAFLKESLKAAVERGHTYVGAVAQYSPAGVRSPPCSVGSVASERPSTRSLLSDGYATPPAARSNGAPRDAEGDAAAAVDGAVDKVEEDEEGDNEVFVETPDETAVPALRKEDSLEEAAAAAQELEGESVESSGRGGYGLRVFLLYNVLEEGRPSPAYYTDTLPIRVTRRGHALAALDADWLDRLSRHLEEGATLADAQILPFTGRGDRGPKALEGLLVFEENFDMSSSPETRIGNDVIVVEQLTLIEGYEVKTDYVPLLHTLAESGWLLTAILPTPVVKPDSEGNLVSKQIVFLQRPMQNAKPTPDTPKSGKKV